MTIDHRLRAALILLAIVLVTATIFYMIAENWTVIDAFYFSVDTTATTVGYGDIVPQNPGSKLFTAVYMVLSTGLALYSIGLIAQKRFLIHLGLHKKIKPDPAKENKKVKK